MENATIEPEFYEGTWEELKKLAPRFNGRKLRVTILSKQQQAGTSTFVKPTQDLGEFLRDTIASAPRKPTPEEIAQAEAEEKELIRNLNENRRRDGAEPIYIERNDQNIKP